MIENSERIANISINTFIQSAVESFYNAGFSYAVWKLPGSNAVYFAASEKPEKWSAVTLEDGNPGFLFSPFDPSATKVFLPADEYFQFDEGQFQSMKGRTMEKIRKGLSASYKAATSGRYHILNQSTGSSSDESAFKELVNKCIEGITSSQFEKVVPSRTKQIQLPEGFDIPLLFGKLCERYPSALVSIFSSPMTGTWIGATPEMLVRVDRDQHFYTAAVAGTQPFLPSIDLRTVTWTQKDIEEQALVERYIINCFKQIRLREFEEHGPKTMVAGNVVHLKTEFEVDMKATGFPQLGSIMLKLLHPTSAVCGMPLESSLAFLKLHEHYNRQFYSGYLGPVHINNESQLYVNLRCMQLFGKEALLYAGAGVLADSDPAKEWNETELKMNTLLEVIRQ